MATPQAPQTLPRPAPRTPSPHSSSAPPNPPTLALLSDHLSLLRRWYYRPEKQRIGEIFLINEDGTWPIRKILRGAARQALGDPRPMAETNREAAQSTAKELKTKILHEGRPDVQRTVYIPPKSWTNRPRMTQIKKI